MTENMEIEGEWFLPESKKRAHGRLIYNPFKGSDLKLYGSLEDESTKPLPFKFKDQEIIHGLSSDNKPITLYRCLMTKTEGIKRTAGQESCKQWIEYRVRLIFIGIHANSKEDLKFNTISSSIFNLDEWLEDHGFEINYDEINWGVSVEYKTPEPIRFKIDDSASGSFNFKFDGPPLSPIIKRAEIKQEVEFKTEVCEDLSIDELLKYLFRFRDFLILASYQRTYPSQVTLTAQQFQKKSYNGKKYPEQVELYLSPSYFNEIDKPVLFYQFIFRYNHIAKSFEEVIQNWYSKYEILELVIPLLNEQFHKRYEFHKNTFLNLAQAAETFHARIFEGSTRYPKKDYGIMKDDILKSAPVEHRDFLTSLLSLR